MNIFHQGPGSVWLSKVPEGQTLEAYKGDGDWFKIASAAGSGRAVWALDYLPNWNITVPKTTPPGKYLMRIEHFYPRVDIRDRPDLKPHADTQFYVNCAQVEIVGEGGGKPAPLVKIPGVYKWPQKDVNFDISGMYDSSKYVAPYSPVWMG